MRNELVSAVTSLLRETSHGVFVTGDLGFSAFEGLREELGRRFINAGVAEQNMIGLSAGLALAGLEPWVYSIAPFLTLRALEQIRNDLCFHKLRVRLVGNGGGYSYGIMGATHHALEDLGVLKTLPALSLHFPGLPQQIPAHVRAIHRTDGPTYLRLGVSGFPASAPAIAENPVTLTQQFSDGTECTVIGVGHSVQIALRAQQSFDPDGKRLAVFCVTRFPLRLGDDDALVASIEHTPRTLILDEHYEPGSIAESLKSALDTRTTILAVRYLPRGRYGSATFHLEQCGLTPERVFAIARGEDAGSRKGGQ